MKVIKSSKSSLTTFHGARTEQEIKHLLQREETLSKVLIWADCTKGYCGPLGREMKEFVKRNPAHHDYRFCDVPFENGNYQPTAERTSNHDVVQVLIQTIHVLQGHTDSVAIDTPYRHLTSMCQLLRGAVHGLP